MRIVILLPLLCAVSASLACGGSEPGAAGPGPEEATAGGERTDAPEAANVPWDDRTPRQKAQFMNEVVVPTMKALFQQFDGQRFAEFGCPTCHGPNAREVQFHMPNGIHPLSTASMPRPDSDDAEEARWATFMSQQVVPKMAELIGEPPYDPATQQGFGCFQCHGQQP